MAKKKTEEQALAVQPKPNVLMSRTGFVPATLDEAYRFATWMSESDMVPETYQGEPGKCMIAYDYSLRLGVSYLMVMQHVYSVYGRPSMEAVLVTALVNKSGIFVDPLDYEVEGKDPYKEPFRVRAIAVRKSNNKKLEGPWISWTLVKAEGWHNKKGSKWPTMPDQMFHYRAASWFVNRHCPEVKMGMLTVDEAQEVGPKHVESTVVEKGLQGLKDRIKKQKEATEPVKGVQADESTDEAVDEAERQKEALAADAGEKKEPVLEKFVCPKCGRTYRYGEKEAVGVQCECGKATIIPIEAEDEATPDEPDLSGDTASIFD